MSVYERRSWRRPVTLFLIVLLVSKCRREPAAAYDFAAHLESAVLANETTRIDFGTPGSRWMLLDGWSQDETWQASTTTIVWATGNASSVFIHRFSKDDVDLTYRCIPIWFVQKTQTISFIVNGHRLDRTELAPGFKIYHQTIPGRFFKSGVNEIRIESRFFAEPRAAEPRPLAVAWDWMEFTAKSPATRARQADGTLWIPARTQLSFLAQVESGCSLRVDDVEASNGTTIDTLITLSDAPAPERHRLIAGNAAQFGLRVSRPSLVEISFVNTTTGAGTSWVKLRRPRIVCEETQRPAQPQMSPLIGRSGSKPNVLIYLVDTLRADHLGVYGYSRKTSPNIDAFARDSLVFTHAIAQSGWTKTSVASILTGRVPFHHGVLDRDDGLPPSIPLLPGMLRPAGYSSFAAVANGNVSATFGFNRGFDPYVFLGGVVEDTGARAQPVVDAFRAWLDRRASRSPFFAYVHTIDPHDPYSAPAPYSNRFANDIRTELVKPSETAIGKVLKARPELRLADIQRDFVAKYDAEIAYSDAMFGRVVADLKRRNLYDSTLIIFTADHGEEFLDHGHWGHGHTLYYELLRVPLIVKLPHSQFAGTTMSKNVQQVDLAPTILDVAGVRDDWNLDGMSLLKVSAEAERPMVSYLRVDAFNIMSAIYGKRQFILNRSSSSPEREELLRVGNEAEQVDRTAGDAWRPELRRTLTAFYLQAQKIRTPQIPIDPELAKQLRALGYLR